MARINNFLRSEAATLTLLALAFLAQAPHAATVFARLAYEQQSTTSITTWLHAISYAIALEFATIIFVVRGQRRLAWFFASVSIAVNVAYYWHDGITVGTIARSMLVAIALPVAIAFYSHDVATQSRDVATSKRKPAAEPSEPQRKRKSKVIDKRDQAMQLRTDGMSNSAIAVELGVATSTVGRWFRNGDK